MLLSLLLISTLFGAPPQEPGGPKFVFLNQQRGPFEAPTAVLAAFEQAAKVWQDVLVDDVTIYVITSFAELDADAGLGGWKPEFLEFPAEDVYAALREDASSPNDRRALRAMPLPGEPRVIPGENGQDRKVFTLNAWLTSREGEYRQRSLTHLSLTLAQAKALVLIPAEEESWDMTLNINSDIHWDMDPSDGIESGQFDLVGTLVREIGHGLGFFSGLDSPLYIVQPEKVFGIFDLFRFNDGSGEARWDLGRGGNPFLSIVDGRESLGLLCADPEPGAGYWRKAAADASPLGMMSGEEIRGREGVLQECDRVAIDLVGWEVRGLMDRAAAREMSKDGQLLRSPKMELRRAEALNQWYRDAPDWALAGIVLTAYGKRWHPVGLESFIAALAGKDVYLQAYAMEGLLNTDEEMLPSLMSEQLVEVLIQTSLHSKDEYFNARVLTLLNRALPQAQATKATQWKRWWALNKDGYLPAEWTLPALPLGAESNEESVAQGFVERAFDLYTAGMELVIVIDATGSMQGAIDASVEALQDFSAIMEGISPRFRMGLVEYRDHEDMKNGAKITEALNKNVTKIRKELTKVRASGGGDFPEAVLAGLQVALSKKMGWEESANKLLVVVGDAPPHPGTMEEILTLVREAYDSPFGQKASEVLEHTGGKSGAKLGVRPFVTSTIGVGATKIEETTSKTFAQIAAAGGGAYSEVLTAGGGTRSASVEIAEHILTLSFGSRWRSQMHDFVRIYMEYRNAGTFQ